MRRLITRARRDKTLHASTNETRNGANGPPSTLNKSQAKEWQPVSSRVAREGNNDDALEPGIVRQYKSLVASGHARVHNGDTIVHGNYYAVPQTAPAHELEECLKSLHFSEVRKLDDPPKSALDGTCSWIWTDSQLGFAKWLRDPQGPYWIQGYPGSGKTTLMGHIAGSAKLQELLGGHSVAVAVHYFQANSSDLARSVEGLLRAVIWQLSQQLPNCCDSLVGRFRTMLRIRSSPEWTLSELDQSLQELVRCNPDHPVAIFVDGLDEHGGRDEYIASFLDRFANSVPSHVRVCLASRPYPDFAFQFRTVRGLKMHEQITEDIRIYVTYRFSEALNLDNGDMRDLQDSVTRKAKGSFLWVRFACDELQRNWRRYRSISDLKDCIETLPQELETFYQRTFDRLEPSEASELARMLNIVVHSARPLSLLEFCHVMEFIRPDLDAKGADFLPYALRPRLQSAAASGLLPLYCPGHPDPQQKDENVSDYPQPTMGQLSEAFRRLGDYSPSTWRDMADGLEEPAACVGPEQDNIDVRRNVAPGSGACRHDFASPTLGDFALERVELAGRGFLTVKHNGIQLSHETILQYWLKACKTLHTRVETGHELLLHASFSYLALLAGFMDPTTGPVVSRASLNFHYPLLDYATTWLTDHARRAERESKVSQMHHIIRLDGPPLAFWQVVKCDKRLQALYPPMDVLEFCIEFGANLTASEILTSKRLESSNAVYTGTGAMDLHERTEQSNDTLNLPRQLSNRDSAHSASRVSFTSLSASLQMARGFDINQNGGRLLFLAALDDSPRLLAQLFDSGAKISPQLPLAATALHRAIYYGNMRFVQEFLEHCCTSPHYHSADYEALLPSIPQSEDDTRALEQFHERYPTFHIDVSSDDDSWDPPAQIAQLQCDPEVFIWNRHWRREFMDNNIIFSPLEFATALGRTDVVEMLLKYVPDHEYMLGSKAAALVTAAYYGRTLIAKTLLERGIASSGVRSAPTALKLVEGQRQCRGLVSVMHGHT